MKTLGGMTVEEYARARARERRLGRTHMADDVWRHVSALWHQELRRTKADDPSTLTAFARAYRGALEEDLNSLEADERVVEASPPSERPPDEDPWTEDTDLDETAALDVAALASALAEGDIPFRGRNPAPPPSSSDEEADQVGQTRILDAAPLPRPATPFDDGDDVDLDATAAIDPSVLASVALPFTPGAAQPPPAAETPTTPQNSGHTAMIAARLLVQEPVPFESRPETKQSHGPPATALDEVQRYASYCVDLDDDPAGPERVRERYGIGSHDAHQALTARWNRRLASEPALRLQFAEAAGKYRAWLRARGHSPH